MSHGCEWGFKSMPTRVLSVLVAVLLSSAPAAYADPPAGYVFLSHDDGLRQARQQQKTLFVYFGRHGCGWCERVNRETFPNAGLRDKLIAHYVLVYVDSESGRRLTLPSGERITEMELGVRFKAFATPVFAYLEPDGRTILKVSGVQTVKDFDEYDRFVHGGIYRAKTFQQFLSDESKP
jgi:thioredoxin-related protein